MIKFFTIFALLCGVAGYFATIAGLDASWAWPIVLLCCCYLCRVKIMNKFLRTYLLYFSWYCTGGYFALLFGLSPVSAMSIGVGVGTFAFIVWKGNNG